ncbi:MAG TPA: ATP-binding protein, partial [Thermoplasmata archaeon]|nr:ATP-binding protein [Thermoplasmata archaeon]
MFTFPPAVIRALEGLSEGSGRTLIVSGPPTSGKSALLRSIRESFAPGQVTLVELRGSYRDRATPYAALAEFDPHGTGGREAAAAESFGGPATPWIDAPMAALAFPPIEPSGRGRRGRSDRGGGGGGLGGSPAPRRGGRVVNGAQLHEEIVRVLRETPPRPMAILIDDGALFDPNSRETILDLSRRVRYRPILLVIALDVSLPAYAAWEEHLIGRGDVDWVRFPHPEQDARESARLKESFEAMPEATRRALAFAALMGGTVSEVGLGRAMRMGYRELADALAPALAVNLVRIAEAKVSVPHAAWIELLPQFLPDQERREIHRSIAEALSALNPEPSLSRSIELARHRFEAAPDGRALRTLVEAAELSERLHAFDSAEELLAKAIECLPNLPAGERIEAEAELRLFHARTLLFTGRMAEGEREVHDGLVAALDESIDPARVEEWVELLVPAVRAVGPRQGLGIVLEDLVDRMDPQRLGPPRLLLMTVLAESALDQGLYGLALEESERGGALVPPTDRSTQESVAMLVDAVASAEGSQERPAGSRFHDPATSALSRVGRHALAQAAEELQLRYVERRRHPEEALRTHLRSIGVLQRMRALA